MADDSEVQVFIDDHHKRCVEALQYIVALEDHTSREHFERFFPRVEIDGYPSGWRVAEAMAEVAKEALTNGQS